jgi:hypothetical protein
MMEVEPYSTAGRYAREASSLVNTYYMVTVLKFARNVSMTEKHIP